MNDALRHRYEATPSNKTRDLITPNFKWISVAYRPFVGCGQYVGNNLTYRDWVWGTNQMQVKGCSKARSEENM